MKPSIKRSQARGALSKKDDRVFKGLKGETKEKEEMPPASSLGLSDLRGAINLGKLATLV